MSAGGEGSPTSVYLKKSPSTGGYAEAVFWGLELCRRGYIDTDDNPQLIVLFLQFKKATVLLGQWCCPYLRCCLEDL